MAVIRPNPFLVLSSLCFVVPITINAFKHQWMLYSINMGILMASSLYHATKYPPLFYVDATLGYFLTFLHFYHSLLFGYGFITLPGIAYCLLMFWYGYLHQCFVWHPSLLYATIWHLSMHGVVLISVTSVAAITS